MGNVSIVAKAVVAKKRVKRQRSRRRRWRSFEPRQRVVSLARSVNASCRRPSASSMLARSFGLLLACFC